MAFGQIFISEKALGKRWRQPYLTFLLPPHFFFIFILSLIFLNFQLLSFFFIFKNRNLLRYNDLPFNETYYYLVRKPDKTLFGTNL